MAQRSGMVSRHHEHLPGLRSIAAGRRQSVRDPRSIYTPIHALNGAGASGSRGGTGALVNGMARSRTSAAEINGSTSPPLNRGARRTGVRLTDAVTSRRRRWRRNADVVHTYAAAGHVSTRAVWRKLSNRCAKSVSNSLLRFIGLNQLSQRQPQHHTVCLARATRN
jgi:hypothetical protein